MSTAQVIRIPVGSAATERVQTRTVVDTFGNTVIDLSDAGTTSVRAAVRVEVAAPSVTLPTATFSDADGVALTGALAVAGHTTLDTVDAASVSATSVSTPILTVADPATDVLEIVAQSVNVQGALAVAGTVGSTGSAGLVVKNASVLLGAGDATSDLTRDSAGIVIQGVPENLPVGRDAADFEHSIRWKRNEGDFAVAGEVMAPHQRPRWTFSGGCVSISGSDSSEWFIAPHADPVSGIASLGIYYQVDAGEPVLVQNFVSESL